MLVIGVDIGGTKCAVSLGEISDDSVDIIHKCSVRETKTYTPQKMLEGLTEDILYCVGIADCSLKIQGIGISCGGILQRRERCQLSWPDATAEK